MTKPTERFPSTTVNSHDLFEVVSALQKSIRRGETDDAIYFAVDLDLSGFGEFCWRRLKVIASEDIGVANPHLPATIKALYDNWKSTRGKVKGKNPDRMFLVHAVILLCQSPKSRLVDHAQMVAYSTHDERREVPDYARDGHTRRGKRLGRGADFFFEESTKLNPEPTIPDPYRDVAWRLKKGGKTPAPSPIRQKPEQLPLPDASWQWEREVCNGSMTKRDGKYGICTCGSRALVKADGTLRVHGPRTRKGGEK